MIAEREFNELVSAVAEVNSLSLEEAGSIVSTVGDTIEVDLVGEPLILHQGKRIQWPTGKSLDPKAFMVNGPSA